MKVLLGGLDQFREKADVDPMFAVGVEGYILARNDQIWRVRIRSRVAIGEGAQLLAKHIECLTQILMSCLLPGFRPEHGCQLLATMRDRVLDGKIGKQRLALGRVDKWFASIGKRNVKCSEKP